MYSRDFSDRRPLPPEYGGTALTHGRREQHTPNEEEGRRPPPPCEEACEEECPKRPPPPPPREERSGILPLFERLLPAGIDTGDLLLLGLAVLLLLDGCEDELLPLLLLFLLIVH
jgi:hypothetical protein